MRRRGVHDGVAVQESPHSRRVNGQWVTIWPVAKVRSFANFPSHTAAHLHAVTTIPLIGHVKSDLIPEGGGEIVRVRMKRVRRGNRRLTAYDPKTYDALCESIETGNLPQFTRFWLGLMHR